MPYNENVLNSTNIPPKTKRVVMALAGVGAVVGVGLIAYESAQLGTPPVGSGVNRSADLKGPPTEPDALEPRDIGDWQVYRNERYGFEVRYPPGWGVRPVDDPSSDYVKILSPAGWTVVSIDAVSVGRESVFDSSSGVTLQDATFARKKVRMYECPITNACPAQLAYAKAIHFTELPSYWKAGNEITYEVYKEEESNFAVVSSILNSFKLVED